MDRYLFELKQAFYAGEDALACNLVFDLSGGTLPITTTKPLSPGDIVHDCLGFLHQNPRELIGHEYSYFQALFGHEEVVAFTTLRGKFYLRVEFDTIDMFRELPEKIASFGMLAQILAKELEVDAQRLFIGIKQPTVHPDDKPLIEAQLARTPRALPTLRIAKKRPPLEYCVQDIVVEGYDPYPSL